MSTWRLPLVACLLLLASGCGSSALEIPPPDPGGGNETTVTVPLLEASHFGYKNPDCGECHENVARHIVERPTTCAACHGANGASSPNGLHSRRVHAANDSCTTCHGEWHGYDVDADCASCHFADEGLDVEGGEPRPVPEDKLRPQSELRSGSFGWPDEPFTLVNHARVGLALESGAAAVDFTLETPAGDQVTLADRLRSRPVVLVTGGFT